MLPTAANIVLRNTMPRTSAVNFLFLAFTYAQPHATDCSTFGNESGGVFLQSVLERSGAAGQISYGIDLNSCRGWMHIALHSIQSIRRMLRHSSPLRSRERI